jgi:hypothetical protein
MHRQLQRQRVAVGDGGGDGHRQRHMHRQLQRQRIVVEHTQRDARSVCHAGSPQRCLGHDLRLHDGASYGGAPCYDACDTNRICDARQLGLSVRVSCSTVAVAVSTPAALAHWDGNAGAPDDAAVERVPDAQPRRHQHVELTHALPDPDPDPLAVELTAAYAVAHAQAQAVSDAAATSVGNRHDITLLRADVLQCTQCGFSDFSR